MGGCDKSIIKVKISNVQCSVLVCWVSLVIVKGYQVGQAQFPLHIFLLTMSKHLLSLLHLVMIFRFIFSIPCLEVEVRLGLNFLKVEVIFILFQSSEFPPLTLITVILFNLSVIECSHNDSSQPSVPVVHLIMTHAFVCVQFV